jgi:hypothetical protein
MGTFLIARRAIAVGAVPFNSSTTSEPASFACSSYGAM